MTVARDVRVLRGVCSQRLKYEIEYNLKRGTTDNSYLISIVGSSKKVLVDVPHQAYKDKYLECLQSETPLEAIDHIVITHLDPKAIPTLNALLEAITRKRTSPVEVTLTNPAQQLLQSSMGEQPGSAELMSKVRLTVAKAGHVITISEGNTLETILTPTPRWPDLMCVHYPKRRLLFTSKLFSAHVAPNSGSRQSSGSPFDIGGWTAYEDDWQHFFDCMLAPVAKQAAAALDRLNIAVTPVSSAVTPKGLLERFFQPWVAAARQLGAGKSGAAGEAAPAPPTGPMQVTALCPMHGPVVRSAVTQLLGEYGRWVDRQIRAAGTASVAVLYASAYGNTAALAQAISRGVTKGGVAVTTLNLEVASLEEVTEAVKRASGFIIGSPTLGGHLPTVVQVALGAVIRESSSKELPCGVFGSFGWSGEAVDELEQRLKDSGFGFAFKAIRVKFTPTAKDLQQCELSGRDLASAVKRKVKTRELAAVSSNRRAALASGCQLAMGRVVGSLCVVTAADEDASSAMLASWISQASFDPPGLTVAVKKDRAMEALLTPGSSFTVSIVPEAAERRVMKALTKAFAPDEDRLAGLGLVNPQEIADSSSSKKGRGGGKAGGPKAAGGKAKAAASGSSTDGGESAVETSGDEEASQGGGAAAVAAGGDGDGSAAASGRADGALVLGDANAYLECRVASRMEAGDHWVVYGTVVNGRVLQEGALTAVHHRKVGNHY